jgi:type 1 fimbria pilin
MKEAYMTTITSRVAGLKRPAGLTIAALGLLLVGMPEAMAKCSANSTPGPFTPIVLNMQVGRVFISPNDPVGTIYPSNSPTDGYMTPVNPPANVAPFLCVGGGQLIGSVVSGRNHISDGWYETNVQGIAIQLSRNRSGSFTTYPHTITITSKDGVGPFQSNLMFVVRLKKIARVTGSGPLAEGDYSTYRGDGSATSVLTTRVLGNAITIVTPTCTVDTGSRTINVPLGKQPRSSFTGVGSTSPAQPFSIKLNCNAGVTSEGNTLNQVHLRMDSNTAVAGTPGLLNLTPGAANATGVGIQVRDEKATPVAFGGDGVYVGQSKDGVFDVRFTARYIQTGQSVTTGSANGTATFTINYK